MAKDADKPDSRRRFFRQALRSMLEAVDEVTKPSEREWPKLPGFSEPSPTRVALRPPGARGEWEFVERCERSGECVRACPVQAIQPRQSVNPKQHDTPIIVASEAACVVCDDLSCMKACPTGALSLIPKEEIDMGLAHVDESLCVRSFGDSCQTCVDKCPLGADAIALSPDGRIDVKQGCIGCGVCELYCPTSPRAIQIVPN